MNEQLSVAPLRVDVDELAAKYSAKIAAARTRLLGVPSKLKEMIPRLTIADLEILDSLTRECLESIADTRFDDDSRLDSMCEQWRPPLVTNIPKEEVP